MKWMWPWAALCLYAFPGIPAIAQIDEAPSVVLARGRLEEARARLAQAGRRFQENPALEVNGGYRHAEDDYLDFEAAVSQGLYDRNRRAARIAGAEAAVERAEAELDDARRLVRRDVETLLVRARIAGDRLKVLTRDRQSADELLAATERRYEAGEATALELNRARASAASARAEQGGAQAEESAVLSELQALTGQTVEIGESPALSQPPDLEALLAKIDQRPDLRAIAAELREAEAEVQLGQALSRPGYGLRGGVGREEGAELVTAGVVVSLPFHDKGQETRAVGESRAAALRQALARARTAAEAEIRGRHSALLRHLDAARELEQTALPALEDNESLALKSFEAGEIGLGELLLLRREILETRLTHLQRLLDASLTRVELETAAGALP
ncbi:MAG TPA: TolC family protein [Thermoanaerobaculia bacterium]|nr:TolC family protein [Thermoanaerobaculia bacterium]